MFKNLLLSLLILTATAHSDEKINENSHLKLKLKIYELKAEISQLNKTIEKLHKNQKSVQREEERRESAIALLKSDLKQGRRKEHDITVLREGS
jgi:septal ring factor EnvC (AmiA/AmiB activator)